MKNIFWDFVVLVKEMRDAQNKYFKERTRESLGLAKRLESTVDERIAFEMAQIRKTKQMLMEFNDADTLGPETEIKKA